jgi:hypothetical protein
VTDEHTWPVERFEENRSPLRGVGLAPLRGDGPAGDRLAEEIGLPGELWQIWAALGELHEQRGQTEEAHGAFSRAARIAERLAGEIEDEVLKEGFLSAPQPRRVMETSARKP